MKQRHSGMPFDDFLELINTLPDENRDIANHTLDQLEHNDDEAARICEWYSAWSGRSPVIHRPLLTLFCGTHQVQNAIDDGASDTWLLDKVASIAAGDAIVNRLCHLQDMGLKLFDLALQLPVADITKEAALDEKSCAGTIAFGMEAIAGGSDLLAVSAIESEPSVSTLAILTVLAGLDVNTVEAAPSKAVVDAAVQQVKGHEKSPLEVLRRLGGRETAAICGAILAARTEHIPTLVDGVTALAACAVLVKVNPTAVAHCRLAQRFTDPAFNAIADDLGLMPIFDAPQSDAIGGGVSMGVGVVKSATKHFPVVGQQ